MEYLNEVDIADKIRYGLETSKDRTWIISPWINEELFQNYICKAADKRLVIRPKLGKYKDRLVKLASSQGWSARFQAKVHAKVYLFDTFAIVGSCNYTINENIERAIFIDDSKIIDKIAEDFKTGVWLKSTSAMDYKRVLEKRFYEFLSIDELREKISGLEETIDELNEEIDDCLSEETGTDELEALAVNEEREEDAAEATAELEGEEDELARLESLLEEKHNRTVELELLKINTEDYQKIVDCIKVMEHDPGRKILTEILRGTTKDYDKNTNPFYGVFSTLKNDTVKMMIEHLVDIGLIEAFQREPHTDYVQLYVNKRENNGV